MRKATIPADNCKKGIHGKEWLSQEPKKKKKGKRAEGNRATNKKNPTTAPKMDSTSSHRR